MPDLAAVAKICGLRPRVVAWILGGAIGLVAGLVMKRFIQPAYPHGTMVVWHTVVYGLVALNLVLIAASWVYHFWRKHHDSSFGAPIEPK